MLTKMQGSTALTTNVARSFTIKTTVVSQLLLVTSAEERNAVQLVVAVLN